jgi:hypothetical protein
MSWVERDTLRSFIHTWRTKPLQIRQEVLVLAERRIGTSGGMMRARSQI